MNLYEKFKILIKMNLNIEVIGISQDIGPHLEYSNDVFAFDLSQ